MDNHYVPNLTIGPLVCEALRRHGVSAGIDVHLMVKPVDRIIPDFAAAGATCITFHPEATEHVDRSLQLVRDHGCKCGLVLNPATPISVLDHVLDQLDMVLLMSVNPGFGGQSFIPYVLDKLRAVRARIDDLGKPIRLEVDGGGEHRQPSGNRRRRGGYLRRRLGHLRRRRLRRGHRPDARDPRRGPLNASRLLSLAPEALSARGCRRLPPTSPALVRSEGTEVGQDDDAPSSAPAETQGLLQHRRSPGRFLLLGLHHPRARPVALPDSRARPPLRTRPSWRASWPGGASSWCRATRSRLPPRLAGPPARHRRRP